MKKLKHILIAAIIAFISYGCTPIGGDVIPDISHASEPAAEMAPEPEVESRPVEHVESKQPAHMSSGNGQHWGYAGDEGPENWGELSPDYHLCKNGKRQSPIDISETKKTNLARIVFNYKSGPKEIVNNGHTIQINMQKGSSISLSGKRYSLMQIHFHSPSEHTIDGKPADMVAHFVHRARDGQYAVVAVLMTGCIENKTLSQLWRKMPSKTGSKKKITRKSAKWIKVIKLIPKNRDYYSYTGSLTTPPCSEEVAWLVLKNTMPVSSAQVKAFTDVYSNNVRPVQEKNYRVVKSKR